MPTPTVPPPGPDTLNSSLRRNIEALEERRRREAETAPWQARLADAITRFTGSMTFVLIHLAIFGGWIVANLGWIPGVPKWDESFVVLAMIASVEAIFLSTFVLISQNRMAEVAEARADLDLQITLLTEHELTKMAQVLHAVAQHLDVPIPDPEAREIERDVAPEVVLDAIEERRERR
ncbi:DUF1003 domain-containing protein [Roseomonas sp. CCTCC AB2023176]|uniref:DUF1003 domain-containing protein n=1 Tax=Roseomonas sp. CCTCC AB2023176 TaxID=3342640 RepID=UPI0035D92ECD